MRAAILATLVSWMFFVRPDGAIAAVFIGIYILMNRARELPAYLGVGALWLTAFVAYSMRSSAPSCPTTI